MDEIESVLTRGPGLTPLGLKLAVGPEAFRDSDIATMVRDGRLRAEPGSGAGILRYYLAPDPPAKTPGVGLT